MDRGQKRLVPKILGGVLRHPRLVNETSEAHNKCATVLYRNQRQTMLQQRVQASAAESAAATATTVPQASIAAVLDRPPIHSKSAAEAHRRQRQAMRELGHQQQHQAKPASASASTFLSSLSSRLAGGKASPIIVGGMALVLTGAAVSPFLWTAGEEGMVVAVPAAQEQAASVALMKPGSPESQQPLWLQRPRQ